MVKRIISLLLILTFLLAMTSCSSLLDAVEYWSQHMIEYPKQWQSVDIVWPDDDEYYAKYNTRYYAEYDGKRYNSDGFNLFKYTAMEECVPEEDVLVGWDSLPLGLGYFTYYYSYTDDNPVFIYEVAYRELYIREDYSYETDTFVIDGTDQSFVFSDMLTLLDGSDYDDVRPFWRSPDATGVIIRSRSCPRLCTQLYFFCIKGTWIAYSGYCSYPIFEVSDEFIKILSDNGIIKTGDGSLSYPVL